MSAESFFPGAQAAVLLAEGQPSHDSQLFEYANFGCLFLVRGGGARRGKRADGTGIGEDHPDHPVSGKLNRLTLQTGVSQFGCGAYHDL